MKTFDKKAKIIALIASFIIGLTNLRFSLLYTHDEVIPLSRAFVSNYFYTWFEKNIGIASSGGIPKILSFTWFSIFPENPALTEFFIIFVGSFVSIFYSYKLFNLWLKGKNPIASLLGAYFYVVNPFITYYIWRTNNLLTRFWFFSFIPLSLFSLQNFLKEKDSKSLFVFCFSQILILPSFTHPAFVIIASILYLCICLEHFLSSKEKALRKLGVYLVTGLCFSAINASWLLPRVLTLSDELQSAASVGLATSLVKNSSELNFARVLIGMDFSSFYEGNMWYNWQAYFLSRVAVFAGYFLLLLIGVGLLQKSKPKFIYSAFILFFISSFLAWGTNASSQLLDLYNKFPVLFAFRDPGKWYSLFIIPFSFLIATGTDSLQGFFDKRRSIFVYTFAVCAITLLGWPVITGFATRDPSSTFPGARIKIPAAYSESVKFLEKNDERTLVLPLIGNHFTSNWADGAYKGVYVLGSLTGASFITNSEPKHAEIIKQVVDEVTEGKTSDLLNMLQVKKLVIHHDTKNTEEKLEDVQLMNTKIKMNSGYTVLFDNPYFTIYQLPTSPQARKNIFSFTNLNKIDFDPQNSSYLKSSDLYVLEDKNIRNKNIKTVLSILGKNASIKNQSLNDLAPLEQGREYSLSSKLTSHFFAKTERGSLEIFQGVAGEVDWDGKPSRPTKPIPIKKIPLQFSAESYLSTESEFVEIPRFGFLKETVVAPSSSLLVAGRNILQNPSFEYGAWQKTVGDCDRYDDNPIIGMKLNTQQKTNGRQSLELNATRHNACLSTNILISPGDYVFQFDYQSSNATNAGYYLVFDDKKKTIFREIIPIADDSWHTLTKKVTVPNEAKNARLYFYPYASDNKTMMVNLYDNVRIKKLTKVKEIGELEQKEADNIPLNVASSSQINVRYLDSEFTYKNMISNPSFEDGTWKPEVGDCNKYDTNPILGMRLNSEIKSEGNQSIQLEATRHNACTSISIPIRGGKSYLLSFDYQSPNAETASYYIGFDDMNKTKFIENMPTKEKDWQHFSKAILAPNDAKNLILYIYAREADGIKSIINRYDNFKLAEVPNISKSFYIVSEPVKKLVEPTSIAFDLINPTKKQVHIKGATTPFFLGMSESYHDQWQLQVRNAKVEGWLNGWWPFAKPDRVGDAFHYKLDGFLNAWYVDTTELCVKQAKCVQNADGSYDIEMTIEFWPQRWFYLGLLISGTTLVGCLGYLAFDGVRILRRKRNEKHTTV